VTSPGPEYETLVAAFALRDKKFAGENGKLLTEVAEDFFGHFALRDVVCHALEYMDKHGTLLPKAALKADLKMGGRNGVSGDTYAAIIDEVFDTQLQARDHVAETILDRAKEQMLLNLAPEDYVLQGRKDDYLARVREIDALGNRGRVSLLGLTEDLEKIVREPAVGTPTGFSRLDDCLNGGGICDGELCIVLGRFNVGKSQFLHNCAVHAASTGVGVLCLSFETSLRNTRMRVLKTALGWSDEAIREDSGTFLALAGEQLASWPLTIKYAAGSDYTFGKMEADIGAAEEKTGVRVGMVVRDYGELMASDPDDYRSVRASYKGFKDFLGRNGLAGLDAAQKNRLGQISHFNLLKDADILLDLDLRGNDDSLLTGRVVRNREGPAGRGFMLHADRATGRMWQHENKIMEDFDERPDQGTDSGDPAGNGAAGAGR
jgi:KaiC/GvpD/RAD55 family RecA-like ATPase